MGQTHTYVMERLNRWVIWCRWGPRPGPKPVASWYGPNVLDRSIEQHEIQRNPDCPVDQDEARETNEAVFALMVIAEELYDVVIEAYIKGGTVEQKMRALGIRGVRSYYIRLDRAHAKLLGLFNDVAAGVAVPKPRAAAKA